MANHLSTKKSIKKIKVRSLINKQRKTRIKTFIKKVLVLVNNKDIVGASDAFKAAQSEIFRGVNKNILKKNTASRAIKRLSGLVKSININ